MAFLLQRIRRIRFTEEFDLFGLHFPFLPSGRRSDQFAGDLDGSTREDAREQISRRQRGIDDDLQALEAGAVGDFEEGTGFRIALRAHPAAGEDAAAWLGGVEEVFDGLGHSEEVE